MSFSGEVTRVTPFAFPEGERLSLSEEKKGRDSLGREVSVLGSAEGFNAHAFNVSMLSIAIVLLVAALACLITAFCIVPASAPLLISALVLGSAGCVGFFVPLFLPKETIDGSKN